MSDSVGPHRLQPTRLPSPWDSPGKNTGVGYHVLLQCAKVKSESEVAQSCLTLSDPMDCSPPGFSIHGIFQARVLEWDNSYYLPPNPKLMFKWIYATQFKVEKIPVSTEIVSFEVSFPGWSVWFAVHPHPCPRQIATGQRVMFPMSRSAGQW